MKRFETNFAAKLPLLGLLLVGAGCAQLHSFQMTDLEGVDCAKNRCSNFELKVSETGVSTKEAANVARTFTPEGSKADKRVSDIEAILAMLQFGPKTGNPVFSDSYADELSSKILAECPSGRVTSLVSIRETRKYPVISGEIVKLKGKCLL